MVNPQTHIQAIGAQLLQERPDHAELPDLREALLADTPVPAQLPANHLTHAVFMDAYAVPWLAERLRSGESPDTIHAYHQVCSEATVGVLLGDLVIERGCLALRFSPLREVLRHDDDALCVVVDVMVAAGAAMLNELVTHVQHYQSLRQGIIDDLKKVIAHLETLGCTLQIEWLTLAGPIVLGPVVAHLRQVVQDLEADLIQ
ncbi:hypothetical protein [Deinococcus marmoris]|nr:hypothetical protein [Deinococcus marmoris]